MSVPATGIARPRERHTFMIQPPNDDDAMLGEQESVERRPDGTSIFILRLPIEEFHALLRAARQSGESVTEYIRKAIALRQ